MTHPKNGKRRSVRPQGGDRKRGRADQLLAERGLAGSRSAAQELIAEGRVYAAGQTVRRPSDRFAADVALEVRGEPAYASRGGRKLEGALDAFGLDVEGLVCVDVGASTGGFTDCVLRRGARKVYAVDVGHGQLAHRLREDPRVVVREGANARHLDARDFDEPVDLVLVDCSFISLDKLAQALARIVRPGGRLLALVKPQFEVGRRAASRSRGVVRDEALRTHAIEQAVSAVRAAGFSVLGEADSAVPGAKGNVERFVLARRQ